ncbi:hypothetical protein [Kitasatospora sp. A2-31]|uniref:hypothetical protein n=1 Tax=Kitasatospora sp. A2-31 TaxID=2916414 RepID=UPI001EE8AA88|nr:hypothetical protein [Kitasatospora sp. A2-31]MCG6493438.1 hypothetical protein [Kitasatospora sp. A2-31]
MEVVVLASGPLFNGTASALVNRFTREGGEEVARWGEGEVQRVLEQVLRHPTGYYQSQVTVNRVSNDSFAITDGGVVYGPWLEGTSRRNAETNFKGYGTFQRVAKRVEARADRTFAAIFAQTQGRL